ncbi:TetR/AcrR family transcriptional regulator [Arthrobacter ginkgonis]
MAETSIPAPEAGRRARKKQQTMALIAGTALQLFLEHGFDGVTVAQIAAAADVSEQTVFNHFRTKEDLVFRGLEAFEAGLLAAIRERGPGESVLAAFGRFLRGGRGLLHEGGEEAREQLAGVARLIAESPALQRREELVFATHAAALAGLLAEETGTEEGDVVPWVAANAMMGVHRSLVAATRRGILQGMDLPRLARETDSQAERALNLLADGLGSYALKAGPEPGV